MIEAPEKRTQTAAESATETPRHRGRPFGPGHDPVEFGRRGGKSSRKPAELRALLEKVLASDGMASYAAAQLLRDNVLEREHAVRAKERKLRTADEMLCDLMDEAEAERLTIAKLRTQVEEVESRSVVDPGADCGHSHRVRPRGGAGGA